MAPASRTSTPPDNVSEAADRAIAAGATKYTALDGTPELKVAVRREFWRENGLNFEQDEVTCGAGTKQIIDNAFMATLDPGDEAVIPAPYRASHSGSAVSPMRTFEAD